MEEGKGCLLGSRCTQIGQQSLGSERGLELGGMLRVREGSNAELCSCGLTDVVVTQTQSTPLLTFSAVRRSLSSISTSS